VLLAPARSKPGPPVYLNRTYHVLPTSDRFPLCLKREMCYAFSPITSLPLECVEFSTAKKKILRQEDICLVLEAT
jgi:hypothetical protein